MGKYKELAKNCNFIPIVAGTYGSLGTQSLKLLEDIKKGIKEVTGKKIFTFWLMQILSMAIQRGNAQCLIDTASTISGLDDLFEFSIHRDGS